MADNLEEVERKQQEAQEGLNKQLEDERDRANDLQSQLDDLKRKEGELEGKLSGGPATYFL